ncbi:MAG TPA: sensor histidine kinase [Candidatus Dormibacteraeota bacterium]|nr:sensor histidine kinase [Candidatus Dormibacteraeota bacterium]
MRTRYGRPVRGRTFLRVLDLGFLAILVAWAQADVWAPQITTPNHMVGDSRVLSVTALAAGLALLARHRWPLECAASVFGLLGIPAVLYGTSEGLGWFLLAGLALYSLGAHAALRPALLGLALYGVWSVLLVTRDPLPHDLESTVRALIYFACLLPTWVIGVVVRNPRLRAVEWERRATRLERERHQAERDAVAKERSLIARELHDIIAHSVSMIVLQAEAGDSRLDSDAGAARQAFHAIEGSARQSMGELRRMLGLLRDDDSTSDPLPQPRLAGVPALLEAIRGAGLKATFEVSGDPIGLAPGLELNAYRIIQEALTNSLKHARAAEVQVHVSYTPGALELEITDDGVIGSLPNGSGGQGLIGMRERALLHGGDLEISRRPSGGYRVWARLPLESAR